MASYGRRHRTYPAGSTRKRPGCFPGPACDEGASGRRAAPRRAPAPARDRSPADGARGGQPDWALSFIAPQPCQRSTSSQALTLGRSRFGYAFPV